MTPRCARSSARASSMTRTSSGCSSCRRRRRAAPRRPTHRGHALARTAALAPSSASVLASRVHSSSLHRASLPTSPRPAPSTDGRLPRSHLHQELPDASARAGRAVPLGGERRRQVWARLPCGAPRARGADRVRHDLGQPRRAAAGGHPASRAAGAPAPLGPCALAPPRRRHPSLGAGALARAAPSRAGDEAGAGALRPPRRLLAR